MIITGAGAAFLVNQGLKPMSPAEARLIRFEGPITRRVALNRLEREGIVRNAAMMEVWARFTNQTPSFRPGSYRLSPGMTPEQVMVALSEPIKQMVRMPEGWWIARAAPILEQKGVCTAVEYVAATKKPDQFRTEFPWLPEDLQSLEGFLFPDTYDLPPGTPAENVIREQLSAFQRKALPKIGDRSKLLDHVTVASLVELEAKKDPERPRISGVIQNRLRKGQPLEIDATVLYALQRWFVLPPGVVRTVDSPFNTYLNAGLPPGPIGSPSLASIEAAMAPETHPYFFYVALPDGNHLFATSYRDHLNNIRRARSVAQ